MNSLQSTGAPRRMAPWQDCRGNTIREGDRLLCTTTESMIGTVKYIEGDDTPWNIEYDHAPSIIYKLDRQLQCYPLVVVVPLP